MILFLKRLHLPNYTFFHTSLWMSFYCGACFSSNLMKTAPWMISQRQHHLMKNFHMWLFWNAWNFNRTMSAVFDIAAATSSLYFLINDENTTKSGLCVLIAAFKRWIICQWRKKISQIYITWRLRLKFLSWHFLKTKRNE